MFSKDGGFGMRRSLTVAASRRLSEILVRHNSALQREGLTGSNVIP
jgi:hypothetical protein